MTLAEELEIAKSRILEEANKANPLVSEYQDGLNKGLFQALRIIKEECSSNSVIDGKFST